MKAEVTLLSKADYIRTPWRNGRGFTEQIAVHPPTSDIKKANFGWRLSTARIEENGPFSEFPLHSRTFVVLSGKGVRLSHDKQKAVDVLPLSPYDFQGDLPTQCELIAGAVEDLNVFVKKDEFFADTAVLSLPKKAVYPLPLKGVTTFFFVCEGTLLLEGKTAQVGECLKVDAYSTPESATLAAGKEGAELLVISIGANRRRGKR